MSIIQEIRKSLEELPPEVQEEVKETLKAYDRVNVVFEDGRFKVNTGYCLRGQPDPDFKDYGEFRANEIYTPEERNKNFLEVFGYSPRQPFQ